MNKIALLNKLQENRSFFYGINSAQGKNLHWTSIIGLDKDAQSCWAVDIANQLHLPVPLYMMERAIYMAQDNGRDRFRWAEAVIKALPESDSAETRQRICRSYIRALLTHSEIGLAASLGGNFLPQELIEILVLLENESNDRPAFVRASGTAFSAAKQVADMEDEPEFEIFNRALCAAAHFAFSCANPESAESAIETGTAALAGAAAGKAQLKARLEAKNEAQLAQRSLTESRSICQRILLESLAAA